MTCWTETDSLISSPGSHRTDSLIPHGPSQSTDDELKNVHGKIDCLNQINERKGNKKEINDSFNDLNIVPLRTHRAVTYFFDLYDTVLNSCCTCLCEICCVFVPRL